MSVTTTGRRPRVADRHAGGPGKTMKHQLACLAVLASMTLGACARADVPASPSGPATSDAVTPAATSALVLEADGLHIGTAMFPFQTLRGEIETAITAALGTAPAVSTNPDCPSGTTIGLEWGTGP
jgi:hypothetical protein